MFERMDDDARSVLTVAEAEARGLGHTQVGTGHLLLGLTAGAGVAARYLAEAGVTHEAARHQIERLLGRGPGSDHPPFSTRARRTIEQASKEADRLRDPVIRAEHLLLALLVPAADGDDGLRLDPDELRKRIERGTPVVRGRQTVISCTFCGSSQKHVKKIIAGPGVYICDECIDRAQEIAASGTDLQSGWGLLTGRSEDRCSYCAKSGNQVRWITRRGAAAICNECIELCVQIIRDEGSGEPSTD